MAELQQPIREPTPDTQPFWDGINRGELILPSCNSCGLLHPNPKPFCAACSSRDLVWIKCSGSGKVHSYVIPHGQHGQHSSGAGFPSNLGEIIAVVEIDEGPRMLASLIGITPDRVQLDIPVEIVFEGVGGGPTMFKFKPV